MRLESCCASRCIFQKVAKITNNIVNLKTLFPALCVCALLFSNCTKRARREVFPSFYHWQTEFQLTEFETRYLDSLKVKKLYLKFFDVDWDAQKKQPVPLASLRFSSQLPDIAIIPTVFITNRTLRHLEEDKLEDLAKKISNKVNLLAEKPRLSRFKEIQFDCDWSPKTKEKYFELLKRLRNHFSKGILISSTIRLHQVRFFKKTGVPPVDKGMLMFYNMGDVEDPQTKNAILDLDLARPYFADFEKYPLKLDIALPIFAWGVLFRDGRMIKLFNNLREENLNDETRFLKINPNHFRVVKSTYLEGHYLYRHDVIRLEGVTVKQLQKTASFMNEIIDNQNLTVAFYHLDTATIKFFPHEKMEEILSSFSK